MKNLIPLKSFRQNMAIYAERVAQGESLIIMKRSKPIFRVQAVEEEGWETVVDLSKQKGGGIQASELLKILGSL